MAARRIRAVTTRPAEPRTEPKGCCSRSRTGMHTHHTMCALEIHAATKRVRAAREGTVSRSRLQEAASSRSEVSPQRREGPLGKGTADRSQKPHQEAAGRACCWGSGIKVGSEGARR